MFCHGTNTGSKNSRLTCTTIIRCPGILQQIGQAGVKCVVSIAGLELINLCLLGDGTALTDFGLVSMPFARERRS